MFTSAEWALTDAHITLGPPLYAALAFVAIGPAVLAYRCWGLGVQTAGPAVAGFFCQPHAFVCSHHVQRFFG